MRLTVMLSPLEAIKSLCGVVQNGAPLGGCEAGKTRLHDVDQLAVGRPQLLDREIAAEEAALRAEEGDGLLDHWLPQPDLTLAVERAEAGELHRDVRTGREALHAGAPCCPT